MPNEQVGKLRVLVADDNDAMRRSAVRRLESVFDVIGSVCSGDALVTAVLALEPDVVVSDIEMPGLTGPRAMRAIRQSGNLVPFVFITAGVVNAQLWLDAGAAGVVHKMDLNTDLVPAVEAAAGGRTFISKSIVS